jgi:hypothetical protein
MVTAIRPAVVMSPLLSTFGPAEQQKLLRAWERADREIPIICDSVENEYMSYSEPEINLEVDDLYILG